MTTKNELIQSIVDQGVTQADFLLFFGVEDHGLLADARERYANHSNDNIEIDDLPLISEADEGTWVSAWVWVPNCAREENDDE